MSSTVGVVDIGDPETMAALAHPLPTSEPSNSPRMMPDELPNSPSAPQSAGPSGKPAVRRNSFAASAAANVAIPRPCVCKEDGRNLVVCIDGTSNQFSRKNTNVVELYSRLKKDTDTQITFYNSGIGTYAAPSWKSWAYYKQVVGHKIDLAIAWQFERILLSAYVWLSENYREGDRIFLFGFSRGAYQVRALSAMIELIGLIHRGNEDQIPFAYELYANAQTSDVSGAVNGSKEAVVTSETESMDDVSSAADGHNGDFVDISVNMQARFKATFSRAVCVHFVGAWDTVSSVGVIRGKNLPGTGDGMSHVCYFRHALALHERRVKFLPEYVRGGLGPDLRNLAGNAPHTKEVWFAGSHSDIGGGSSRNETLDRFGPSLRWMLFEATQFGLQLDRIPREWRDMSQTSESLSGIWLLLEYLPIPRLSYTGQDDISWLPHLGQPRIIQAGQRVHESAVGCVDGGRATVCDILSWDELVDDEHVERDVYAAAGHIFNALIRRSKRSQPLRPKDIQALSVLLLTERGKASLREIEDDYSSKRSESLGVPLLSGLALMLKDVGVDSDMSVLPIEAARTVLNVLTSLDVRFRPGQLRPAARALSKADEQLADELMTRFSAGPAVFRGHTAGVTSVAFLPDGRRIVSSSKDGTLRIWNIDTGNRLIKPLEGSISTLPCVAVHGSHVASCSYDGTFCVWEANDGKRVLNPIKAHNGRVVCWIAYSRDGTRIATAGDDNRVVLWDANTGVQLRGMSDHTDPVMCVAFSEDGTRLVSGSQDRTVRIWDSASGERVGEPLAGHAGWVFAVCFSPDNKRIFSSSDDSTIRIWDAETRALIFEPLQIDGPVLCMALSPDGKRLISGSSSGKIAMWDAESGATTAMPFKDHEAQVWGVAFSPDGRKIASASRDGTIALWDATADWRLYNIDDENV